MCGIAGLIWNDLERPASKEAVAAMTAAIAYRGPDDEGFFLRGPVALGHRRLSILDLSVAGHQPMRSDDGRYVVVFNGEIYNYIELRGELRDSGHRFASNTDTEVLMEAYREWGRDCVQRFDGMWAFAIYDLTEETVFLSRDRFGIKPLHYVLRGDCLAFASEIKAILAALPDERRPNLPLLHYFLPSGALCDGPETFFQNVLSLPPAHSATYELRTGRLQIRRYWDLDADRCRARWLQGSPEETLWQLLNSSVELHMRSDVPVGTCLSGGLDSSTIVALMSRQRSQPVHTYSGLYPDRDCDESEYVDAVNASANTSPRPVHPEPRGDLCEDIGTITWHQDMPSAGPGLYTQYKVMARASLDVKVILDGQGGDELFAGYISYFGPHIEDLLDQRGLLPRARALWLAAEVHRRWGACHIRGVASRLAERSLSRRRRAIARASSMFHPSLVERAGAAPIRRSWPEKFPGRLANALYWHVAAQCLPALLHYEDRNSMAYSIEARVPLLDYRIAELAFALDSDFKIRGSWTKWILRRQAERVLPKKVAWRRSKLGYPTPFARWLRQDSERESLRAILFSGSLAKRELLSAEALRFYWDRHASGSADCSWLLWRVISLELWYRHFIDSWKPQTAPMLD